MLTSTTAQGASTRHPFWAAPLVPVATALTAGILLDRFAAFPLALALVLAAILLAAWFWRREAIVICLAAFFFGAGYHSWRVRATPADSLARLPSLEDQVVALKGRVVGAGQRRAPPAASPLRTARPLLPQTSFLLRAEQARIGSQVHDASGLVQVWIEGDGPLPRSGEIIEVVGLLHFPSPAANPGGSDQAAHLGDQGIVATLSAEATEAWRVLGRDLLDRAAALAWLHDQARTYLEVFVPNEKGLAVALLLGDGDAMSDDDWQAYLRTGVVHALAISGQHLAILAWFLILVLRLGHVPARHAAPAIALFLLVYALLTGGRPPVMRAAWIVLALTIAAWIRRPVLAANAFSLAWIAVALWRPADVFDTGCLLSFLAAAVLMFGFEECDESEPDPVQLLLAEQRPAFVNFLLKAAGWVGWFYLINALVWLAVSPLIASRLNQLSPVALLVGPPIVFLTSAALLAGLLTLLVGIFMAPLGFALGWLAGLALSLCRTLVTWAEQLPGAYVYVADIGDAWLIPFYVGLIVFLTVPAARRRLTWFWVAAVVWLGLGWMIQSWPRGGAEFRCTFLAVGHGSCIVLEAPDGSVLLYDAGAMTGPEVTRRHIAPFLWSRGIRRLDRVILSHADLDHFNGLPALLERFTVGQISLTPSFAQRDSPGVRFTLEVVEGHGLKPQVLKAGDGWQEGGLDFEVLHPPSEGPEGNENSRSLVLLVRHDAMTILLTGDLEGPGLAMLLDQTPRRPVDVLMAPHHGSPSSNISELAERFTPRVVVSCQGRPKSPEKSVYARSVYLTTWEHGAVSVRLEAGVKVVQTYRSGKRWELR